MNNSTKITSLSNKIDYLENILEKVLKENIEFFDSKKADDVVTNDKEESETLERESKENEIGENGADVSDISDGTIIPQLDGILGNMSHNLGNDGYQIGVLYPCDECDSQFSHEKIMHEHKRKKHNVNRLKRKKKGRP